MRISLSITDFSWPRSELAARLADVAGAADDGGLDTLWVADHLLQADPNSQPDAPMLEAYTTLGFLAARSRRLRLGTTPAHLPRARAGDQGRHHARRSLGWPRVARAGGRLRRRRGARHGSRFAAHRRAFRAPRGDPPARCPDVGRRRLPIREPALPARAPRQLPAAADPPASADPHRRHGRAQDATARRRPCRRLQPLRNPRRGQDRPPQARRARPPLRRPGARPRQRRVDAQQPARARREPRAVRRPLRATRHDRICSAEPRATVTGSATRATARHGID